jgi:hypothetical protein
MKSRLLILFIIFFTIALMGCASSPPKSVEIPVATTYPVPDIPCEPHYPIFDLKENDTPDKVIKAYVATLQLQRGYIKEINRLLRSYLPATPLACIFRNLITHNESHTSILLT